MNKGRRSGLLERGIRTGSLRRVVEERGSASTEGAAIVVIAPPPLVIGITSANPRRPLSPRARAAPASASGGGGPVHASGPRQNKLAAVCNGVGCPVTPSFVPSAMRNIGNHHLVVTACVGSVASAAKRVPRSPGPGKPRDFRGWVHDACAVAGSVRQAAPCRVVCVLRVVQRASA